MSKGRKLKRIAIFCGASSPKNLDLNPIINEMADDFFREEIEVVYGGAAIGIMGEVATSMIRKNVSVIGVIPQQLMKKEIAHGGLDQLYVVKDMHERKQKMYKLADAFLILPGGMGTLDEFFEILTWKQLGLHAKPIAILNEKGYYDHLINLIQHAIEYGLISKNDQKLFFSSHRWQENWSYLRGEEL